MICRVRALKQLENSRIREFLLRYDLNDLPKQKYQNQTWVDVNQVWHIADHSAWESSAPDIELSSPNFILGADYSAWESSAPDIRVIFS